MENDIFKKNILEASNSLEDNIEFMKMLLKHMNGQDKGIQIRSLFGAWCIHRYINDILIEDVEKAIENNKPLGGVKYI
jgi:hypothetical protein